MGSVDSSLWVPDDMAPKCCLCRLEFSIYRRRHHCRWGLRSSNTSSSSGGGSSSSIDCSLDSSCGIIVAAVVIVIVAVYL